jgi:hypothetical protein
MLQWLRNLSLNDSWRLSLPSAQTMQFIDITAFIISLVFLGLVNQMH